MGDAAPALYTFGSGLGQVLFSAAGEDGGDACGAEFGGFFNGPLEVIKFEDSEQEVEWEGSVGLEFFMEEEVYARGVRARVDVGDLGAVEEAGGDDVEDLAGLGTEDAGKMEGLVADEGGGGGVAGFGGVEVGNPAASGHKGQ